MNRKSIVILLGPPGSGKGTLSQLCIEGLGWDQLSTGALCRKHILEKTEIGKQIDFSIKSGKLIADNLIIDMVGEWLFNRITVNNNPTILDGFPRTIAQARALDTLFREKLTFCSLNVVKLTLSDNSVINRLLDRSVCQNTDCQAVYSLKHNSELSPKREMVCDRCKSPLIKRTDDTQETVLNRIQTYHLHANDLINYYETTGCQIHEIDGEPSLNEVFECFKKIMCVS